MGSGRWDPGAWSTFSSSTAGKSTAGIYTAATMKDHLNPLGVAMRESRDSPDNPNSTPIIVGLDVTGSMGMLADTIAREGLGVLFSEILDRKPVSDPHIMFMGIGDFYCDRAPLQVSQFEADDRIIEQLVDLFIEHGGGGNSFESYNGPWYFAATHTSTDCFEKRGKKGYLFTIGDENAPGPIPAAKLKQFLGDEVTQDLDSESLLRMAQKMYHVFHIVAEEGSHCRGGGKDRVLASWRELMGQNVLPMSDHTKLAEIIVSAIQVVEGADKDTVAKSWKGATTAVVARAIDGMSVTKSGKATKAVTRF